MIDSGLVLNDDSIPPAGDIAADTDPTFIREELSSTFPAAFCAFSTQYFLFDCFFERIAIAYKIYKVQ